MSIIKKLLEYKEKNPDGRAFILREGSLGDMSEIMDIAFSVQTEPDETGAMHAVGTTGTIQLRPIRNAKYGTIQNVQDFEKAYTDGNFKVYVDLV